MSTYVVAGVTGHVGSVVAADLVGQSATIRAIVRDETRGAEWRRRGAELAVGSLDDAAFLARTLAGADGFFVLLPPNETAPDFYAVQRRTSDAIAAAVKRSGVARVVMLSSVGAELPDGTGPIKCLHYLENALRATGAKLAAIRAGYFQENVANVIPPARQAGIYPNFLPTADTAIPMVATRDIGHLAARLLQRPPGTSEIVDLVGPAYSARQVAEKLGALLGKALQVVDIPAERRVETLTQSGMPRNMAEILAEMMDAISKGLLTPKGDNLVTGSTTLDEVLPTLVERTMRAG